MDLSRARIALLVFGQARGCVRAHGTRGPSSLLALTSSVSPLFRADWRAIVAHNGADVLCFRRSSACCRFPLSCVRVGFVFLAVAVSSRDSEARLILGVPSESPRHSAECAHNTRHAHSGSSARRECEALLCNAIQRVTTQCAQGETRTSQRQKPERHSMECTRAETHNFTRRTTKHVHAHARDDNCQCAQAQMGRRTVGGRLPITAMQQIPCQTWTTDS